MYTILIMSVILQLIKKYTHMLYVLYHRADIGISITIFLFICNSWNKLPYYLSSYKKYGLWKKMSCECFNNKLINDCIQYL